VGTWTHAAFISLGRAPPARGSRHTPHHFVVKPGVIAGLLLYRTLAGSIPTGRGNGNRARLEHDGVLRLGIQSTVIHAQGGAFRDHFDGNSEMMSFQFNLRPQYTNAANLGFTASATGGS